MRHNNNYNISIIFLRFLTLLRRIRHFLIHLKGDLVPFNFLQNQIFNKSAKLLHFLFIVNSGVRGASYFEAVAERGAS